jgi:dipeptidyl aminopeptidase/acylaminoacyl peptidase
MLVSGRLPDAAVPGVDPHPPEVVMAVVRTRADAFVLRSLFLAMLAAAAVQPAAAQHRPTLTPADYAKWESLGATVLSPDGAWLAWVVNRVDQDEELRYRRVADDSTRVVPLGGRPAFSADGRWLAYSIGVSRAERERAEGAPQQPRSKAGIVDLRTGATTVVDDIVGFEFSGDGRFLTLRGYAPAGGSGGGGGGADIIVRTLADGTDVNFGNVASYAWRDEGALLAMVIAAGNRVGNGVRLFDPATGVVRTLVSDTAEFTGLVWRSDADDLAVFRVRGDDGFEEPTHSIHVWRGAGSTRVRHATLDPAATAGFPADHRVIDGRTLRFSEDGATLFFGIRPWTRKPVPATAVAAADSAVADSAGADGARAAPPRSRRDREPAGVEVWHSADVDIIPEQKVRSGIDQNRSMLAAWHLDSDRFVQLATDLRQDVTLSDGRTAVLLDGRAYDEDRMFGPVYRDIYALDIVTGERVLAAQRVQHQYGPSPSGRYLLFVRDGDYWSFDTRTRQERNLTAGIATSFVNLENDLTIAEKPPFGTGGWATDDRTVLLYDRYDIWEVRADGSRARNLTGAADERIRHRRIWLTPDDRFVDLAQPIYLTLYGEWTKQFGFGRLLPGGRTERLVLEDRNIGRLGKAADADVYFFRGEAFDQSPNWYVAGPRLADARRVTDTNPFQRDYAWGRSELVNFRNSSGQELQAALHYPANWEPGRQYPMVVYYYETVSNQIHNYVVPSETSAYNPTIWTQDGYFVLRPDIVYRGRDPGLSAVEALVPAAERMLETGMIDRDRIGLIGHSWGGYQTAFTVTQTDLFAAAVAGAPLTNLISMYLSVYWNTGTTDARIFEISQGRMEVPFWEDLDAYTRNSPVFHIRDMNTPLLVAFGDRDGAVEFNQGVELYNAARRAGKDMVLLVYEGENHSLARRPNQLDYHRRIREWFAHYLKGEPPAAWITDGVRHQDRQREIERLRTGAGR